MKTTVAYSQRPTRPAALGRRPAALRGRLVGPFLGLATVIALLLAPALASADSPSTLTVVGTSDVSDSGLIPTLIQPEFQNAFPQYTFKYVGSATGAAIQSAENGTGGPSALIVHASSLENQFVAGGFSFNNQFGNAIWTNDFVLAGPTADPAGVGANAANNIAQSFADIATAGNSGTATLDSRGGTTTASGTTVAEHGVWALVDSSGLAPASLVLCKVSAADGGGETPIKSSVQATSGQPCPDSGSVNSTDAPTWYAINTGNQAANVTGANACTGGFTTSGANSCYVFTDRGTFDFLSVGGSITVAPSLVPNLSILTRNNSASAPGGANELTNYFHVYIINPSSPGETVNLTAAQDFVNFLTSPAVQGQLKNYLANTGDPAGAPFVADASPIITASGLPSVDAAGRAVTITGNVTNAEPHFPTLVGKTVSVDKIEGGLPVAIATGATDANGNYRITFTPTSNGSYQVSTGQISQIEDSSLSPQYGDLLSPGATAPVTMNVQGSISITSAKASSGGATVAGAVAPAAPDGNATVSILARHQGSTGAFSNFGSVTLAARQSAYAASAGLPPGKWQLKASLQDPGQVLGATSSTVNVTVPNASTSASFSKLTIKNGALTVTGTLSQAPTTGGAQVRLFALSTVKVKVNKPKARKHTTRAPAQARTAAVSFRQVAKTNVGIGKTKYTIKAKFKRGFRYVLQLEFVQKGQPSTFSKLRTLDVH